MAGQPSDNSAEIKRFSVWLTVSVYNISACGKESQNNMQGRFELQPNIRLIDVAEIKTHIAESEPKEPSKCLADGTGIHPLKTHFG